MRMIPSNSQELMLFLRSVTVAFIFCLSFDLLASPKTRMKESFKNFYDAFTWFVMTLVFCISWHSFLSGELRWYMIAGFLLTLLLYRLTLHRPIFMAFCTIIEKISVFFDIISEFLLTSIAFLSKINLCFLRILKKIYSDEHEGISYEKDRF